MSVPGAKFVDQNSQFGDAGTSFGFVYNPQRDDFTVQTDGQTVFVLSFTPLDQDSLYVNLNGQWLRFTTDFTLAGGTITLNLSNLGYSTQAAGTDGGKPGPADKLTAYYLI